MSVDLFGEPITEEDFAKPQTILAKWTRRTDYRWARGEDRQCKNCSHLYVRRMGRRYFKCRELGLTSSPASDIRLHKVCNRWEEG